MQSIRMSVMRDARFRCVDGFHVYGDGGSGVMDWDHPVTPRRMLFWNDAECVAMHVEAGHLMARHLDSIRFDGHLDGVHLLDEHTLAAGTTVVELGPFVFGRFRHAVVTEDEIGNRQPGGATIYETAVNSAPAASSRLRAESHDEVSGVLAFSFVPSEKLSG